MQNFKNTEATEFNNTNHILSSYNQHTTEENNDNNHFSSMNNMHNNYNHPINTTYSHENTESKSNINYSNNKNNYINANDENTNNENTLNENNNGNQNEDGNNDNQSEEGSQSNANSRKKRRSKNDQDGRSFKCKHCDKTYLSEIALNNHVKTKHAHLVDIIARGRGRPRKSQTQSPNSNQVTEMKFKEFFNHGLRKKNNETNNETETDNTEELVKICKENFAAIYGKYNDRLFKDINSYENFSFIGPKQENEKNCDEAFWKYLEFCFDKVNKEYFEFIFKFVILFRECINQKKKAEIEVQGLTPPEGEYSTRESAEIVPDMCNDFVSEFMEGYDYFGLDIAELIELIQHCCHWLWENHHTTSRLTLINN